MARLPRVVIPEVAHHVTQRGNARQVILADDTDRIAYLELLRQSCALYGLSLLGYCLMTNHVHLIVVPHTSAALGQTLKQAHGRYAAYWNAAGGLHPLSPLTVPHICLVLADVGLRRAVHSDSISTTPTSPVA
jgi:putative transposase